MGVAKLITLLVVLLILVSSFVGLSYYFIKYINQIKNTQ